MTSAFGVEMSGDRAVVLRFGARPSRTLSAELIALGFAARQLAGVVDAVPGHRTLLIECDPAHRDQIAVAVKTLSPTMNTEPSTLHRIEVRYDGPDIDWAGEHLGMSVAEIVRMHSATTYDVRLIGAPGFVYLSAAPAQLHMPRRDEPRLEVPAGSVGIGGRQCGIYSRAMPGGWRILGAAIALPSFQPGDRVRFVPTP